MGVINKRTGKLRYAELQHGEILRVEPKAHGINYEPREAGALDSSLSRLELYAQNRR